MLTIIKMSFETAAFDVAVPAAYTINPSTYPPQNFVYGGFVSPECAPAFGAQAYAHPYGNYGGAYGNGVYGGAYGGYGVAPGCGVSACAPVRSVRAATACECDDEATDNCCAAPCAVLQRVCCKPAPYSQKVNSKYFHVLTAYGKTRSVGFGC